MHAVAVMIVMSVSGYTTANSKSPFHLNSTGDLVTVEGAGNLELGRLGGIVKPVNAPSRPPLSHNPFTYSVHEGDDTSSIATRFNLTTDEICWSNPNLTCNAIRLGDTLVLPPTHGVVYTTKGGDTLDSVASKYRVTAMDIAEYNYMKSFDVPAGVTLVIPNGQGPTLSRRGTSVVAAPVVGNAARNNGTSPFPYGYCTWYAWSKAGGSNGWVTWMGNAGEWAANARAQGYPTGQVPKVGSIMVTNESYVGHVAWVESVNSDGSWMVSEMNFSGWGVVSTRTIKPGGVSLVAFIYNKG